MIKVLMLTENEYIILGGSNAIYGDAKRTVKTLHELGVNINEIEYGLMTMIHKSHNVAEYGVNRTFIFSKRIGVDTPKAAEETEQYSRYKEATRDFQFGFITAALDETNGNKSAAMRLFGIPRKSLYRRLKKIH